MVAFRQALALFVEHESVVKVERFGQTKEHLQQAVDVGGRQQVLATGDVGDFLKRIVDDYREMVGDADVLAGER